MFKLQDCTFTGYKQDLSKLPKGKLLINTINAHSYNVAQKDNLFAKALLKGNVLIPDGESIVFFSKWFWNNRMQRIAGADLFEYEMTYLNHTGGKCFFMGSSEKILYLIKQVCVKKYPNIVVETYSPPFKSEFSDEENKAIINAINDANPDLLWIGMTAPKQEKWTYFHWNKLNIHCHCGTIGAVFDFCAGTTKRAPNVWQHAGLEWLYRLLKEPRRMWRRYLIGNCKFIYYIFREKFST